MRKKVFIILLSLICVICLAFGITACGGSSDDGDTTDNNQTTNTGSTSSTIKQVPVYQGMVISSAESTSTASAKLTAATLTADNMQGGGNYGEDYYYQYHHYRGDYEGKDNDIDYDQPFDDDTPTIEQEIETTLKVTGTGQSIYYADKNEKIYITIKLSNPDSYEILSFVLNGTKYTSYMFQEDSDLENIIIKLDVGSVGGIQEYTIDEIKYVDGTDIKDVALDGDTVVKCGVRADDQTYATISNETHDLDSISFDAKIVDLYNLIEYSEGYAKAVLYDGDSLVQTVDLTVGTTTVEFTNLSPNTLYQYAVVALYDDLSGTGTALNYLYKNAVYTDTIVLFDNITVGQESITFGYSWYAGYSAATITQLTLAAGGKTETLTSSATSAANLLSNTEYVLTAYYKNLDEQTESISLTFTTLEKATPEVTISTLNSTQTAVNYVLSITDTDSVGSLTSVTLKLGNTTVETATTASGSFTGLLSNNTYTVTAVYTYNLNDGNGDKTITVTRDITTQAKATPAVTFSTLSSTQTAVDYALSITDTDSVGSLTSVTLKLGNTTVETLTTSTGTFSSLLSNNTYTVTAVYTYNLNDGNGDKTITVTRDITTQAKATPAVTFSTLSSTQTAINYALSITDTDGVGSLTSVTLSLGETEKDTATTTSGSFTGLLSNNTYTVTAVYTYNLNDGNGNKTITVTRDITTQAKATPAVTFSTLSSTQTSVDYVLSITDTDGVGSLTSVTLSLNGTTVETFTTSTGTFSNLLSNNTYAITVVYTYDLKDGKGEQIAAVTDTITTQAKATPAVDIEYTDSSTSSLTFDLTFTDNDSVGAITAIGLYNGSTLVQSFTDLTQTTIEFTNLTSYTEYTVKVDYKYNLNDGNGEQETSSSLSVYTDPVIEFESLSITNSSAVSEGETIYIQATMYNPSKATFTSIVVNGEIYSVSSISTSTSLRANIVNNGQFEGGNTTLTITQVICTLGGNTYTINITNDNSASVFINGELSVEDFAIVYINESGEYEEVGNCVSQSEQIYYQISLSNSTCYNVDSVTVGGGLTYDDSSIVMSTDYQTVYVTISADSSGWYTCSLTSLSYYNDYIDADKTVDFLKNIYIASDEIVEISTAEQLLDVDDYKYYKLVNDIDLSGYEWANMNNIMNGVFDGNGYSIINMSAYTTYSDTDLYIGLFRSINGVVMNLTIKDAVYMITVNDTTDGGYVVYAGGIAAKTNNNVIIENCNIDISMQITDGTNGTYMGGVIGEQRSTYVILNDITINVVFSYISSADNIVDVGGIMGYMEFYRGATISGIDLTLNLNINSANCKTGVYFSSYFGYGYTLEFSDSTADMVFINNYSNVTTYAQNDYIFEYSNGTYYLTEYIGSETDLILPDNINGSTYEINSYAFADSDITSVVIPDGVTSIGNHAFYNCTSLTSVTV